MHHHAFTGKPLGVSGGTCHLAHQFLHIVFVVFKLFRFGHIDCIFGGIEVRHACGILAHGKQVFPDLRHEPVHRAAQLSFLALQVTPVCTAAEALLQIPVFLRIRHRQSGLVDVEQDHDFPLAHSFVELLLCFGQGFVCLTGQHIFRVMAVHVLVPLVPVERHAVFLLQYCLSTLLCVGEHRI